MKSQQRGFTLLEMLVALLLLGLLMAAITGGLRLAVDTGQRLAGFGQQQSLSMVFVQRIRQLLNAALPWPDAQALVGFQGDQAAVRWVAVADGHGGDARPYLFHLFTQAGALVLESCPVMHGLTCFLPPDRQSLSATGLRLSYHTGGEWRAKWDQQTRLPSTIRLELANMPPSIISIAMGQADAVSR